LFKHTYTAYIRIGIKSKTIYFKVLYGSFIAKVNFYRETNKKSVNI